ncbi:MSMEG_1061 family FMN-dependent PPOX-type flavoprotein [Marinomonas pollencensis]|uniref:Pyridoxamine 5'-phosphate oxidase N-terminal domain-containing protein n=1 Tax=Marinomonas pollencensis TaxID=491954 RepID=A0A3E0DQ69_9GAMM|nr:MSMEG_1061 family FMN-dependent PPOX-type flavoprotein [Marinomonas pollencensis]REG83662.1 hypothetical protein DFP81_10528 [Marinomonas pollencensis]
MGQITCLEQLDALYATPHPITQNKAVYALDTHLKTFVAHSPFVVLSTQNTDGLLDVSPRGGEPGFIKVLNDTQLLIPDSPGNNRLDSIRNILVNPNIGILFVIPGINEVLRLKGQASVYDDPELLACCPDGEKPAKLVIKITLQSAYFHCPKALIKGRVWSSDAHTDRAILPSLGHIIKQQQGLLNID